MTPDLAKEYARLSTLTLNVGTGDPRSFGVYLGETVTVFNLPNPASIGTEGAPAFDSMAPSQSWAELLATGVAQKFGRPDALQKLVVCAFGQEHGGAAKLESGSVWIFRDQGRTFADSINIRRSGEIDKVKELLMLNTGTPDIMYGQQMLQEIDQQTLLMGQVGQNGYSGILVIGDVQIGLAKTPELEHLSVASNYSPLPTGRCCIQVGKAQITLTAARAQGIRDAAERMMSAATLAKLRSGAVRWGDLGTIQIAALLTKAAEERDALTPAAPRRAGYPDHAVPHGTRDSTGLLERGRQFAEDVHHVKVMIELVEKVSHVVTAAGPAILLAMASPNIATGVVAATAIGHAMMSDEHPRPRE